jgi:hypothetical protein
VYAEATWNYVKQWNFQGCRLLLSFKSLTEPAIEVVIATEKASTIKGGFTLRENIEIAEKKKVVYLYVGYIERHARRPFSPSLIAVARSQNQQNDESH